MGPPWYSSETPGGASFSLAAGKIVVCHAESPKLELEVRLADGKPTGASVLCSPAPHSDSSVFYFGVKK